MQRDLVLASTAIVLGLASACGGQIAEPDGEGTNYGLGPSGSARGSGSSGDEDDETFPGNGKRPGGGTTDDGDDGPWGGPGPSGSGGGSVGGYPGSGTTSPNACFTVQDGSVCADMKTAKDHAAKICAGKGYELTALTIGASGDCSITCCDGSYPSPPPPPKCTSTKVGDGTTCMSNGEVEKRAYKACADMNLDVRSISWSDDCKKGTRVAQVECCAF